MAFRVIFDPIQIYIISKNRWLISQETFKKLLHHHPLLQFSIKSGRGENQEDDEDFDGESANAQKRKVTKEKLAGIRFLVIRDTVFPGKGWKDRVFMKDEDNLIKKKR